VTGPGLLLGVVGTVTLPPCGSVVGLGTMIIFILEVDPRRREMSRPILGWSVFFWRFKYRDPYTYDIVQYNHTSVSSRELLGADPKKQHTGGRGAEGIL